MGRKKKQNNSEEKIAGYEIVRLNIRNMQKNDAKFKIGRAHV